MNSDWGKSTYSFSNGNCVETRWAKSSYSNPSGDCLEARFAKSSHSVGNQACLEARWHASCYNGGSCVEARQDGLVQVRDSKLGEASPILDFAPGAWQEFIDAIKAGWQPA